MQELKHARVSLSDWKSVPNMVILRARAGALESVEDVARTSCGKEATHEPAKGD